MKNVMLSILKIFLVCLLMSYIDVTTKVPKTYYILLDRNDSTVQYREDTVESSSRIRQWYSLYSDDHSEWGVLFKEGVDSLKIVPLIFLDSIKYYDVGWLRKHRDIFYIDPDTVFTCIIIDRSTIKNDSVSLFEVTKYSFEWDDF